MNAKPLKIGIEAKSLCSPLTGIGRVVFQYIQELQKADQKNQYFILTPEEITPGILFNARWENHVFYKKKEKMNFFLKIKKRIIKKLFNFAFSFFALRYDFDILIMTSTNVYPLFPLKKKVKLVPFIYDLVWKLYPRTMAKTNRWILKNTIRKIIKKSFHLITISQSVAQEFKTLLNSKKPITAIPLAAGASLFYPAPAEKSILAGYGIHKPYLLSVCTLEPRKNLVSLLHAFSRIKNKEQFQLVLTGKLGWGNENYLALIRELEIEKQVVITGYVPDSHLAPLYSCAEVFVYPSFYEGFGLPILEAMQCGCPVISSKTSSMPEVGGEAALYIDPENTSEITSAIEQVLSDSLLQEKMKKSGIERAKEFSWEKSAKKLLQIINEMSLEKESE